MKLLVRVAWKLILAKPIDAFINVWQNGLLNLTLVEWHNTSLKVNTQFLANLQGQYDRLNNLPCFSNSSNSINNLIFNNYKILSSSKSTNTNKLLLIEVLHIKFNKPKISSGLKASKEVTLFN